MMGPRPSADLGKGERGVGSRQSADGVRNGCFFLLCWLNQSAGVTSLVDLIKPGQEKDY